MKEILKAEDAFGEIFTPKLDSDIAFEIAGVIKRIAIEGEKYREIEKMKLEEYGAVPTTTGWAFNRQLSAQAQEKMTLDQIQVHIEEGREKLKKYNEDMKALNDKEIELNLTPFKKSFFREHEIPLSGVHACKIDAFVIDG